MKRPITLPNIGLSLSYEQHQELVNRSIAAVDAFAEKIPYLHYNRPFDDKTIQSLSAGSHEILASYGAICTVTNDASRRLQESGIGQVTSAIMLATALAMTLAEVHCTQRYLEELATLPPAKPATPAPTYMDHASDALDYMINKAPTAPLETKSSSSNKQKVPKKANGPSGKRSTHELVITLRVKASADTVKDSTSSIRFMKKLDSSARSLLRNLKYNTPPDIEIVGEESFTMVREVVE